MARSAGPAARRVLLALQSVTVGGMEGQCVDLARELARLGVQVAVVVPKAPAFDALAERFALAGARVERLDTDARDGRVAQGLAFARLIRFMRGWRPDTVHVHTGGPTGGMAIVAAVRVATSATVVLTEHNVPFAEPGTRLRLATRLKDRLLHAVVTLSARNAELRRTWLGEPDNFVGIPPGVRIADADPDLRAAHRAQVRDSLGVPSASVVITSVARLVEGKGLDDLMRAFADVRLKASCDLVLVGDGPLRKRLQALATNLGVADQIHFVGYQPDPGPVLDATDIFALAAPLGSGSVALLEAMARGLPAVITYCGPGEFVVPDETGLCAPPRDPAALARVLLRLVRDPDLRSALGLKAAARARDRFRIEHVTRDLLEVYASAKGAVIPERLRAARLDTW